MSNKKAFYYEQLQDHKVKCTLCPNFCVLGLNSIGICRGRKNIKGELVATNYGKTISYCLDPIEKKPLFHFMPFTNTLSLGSNSCNLSCDFCQNYRISQLEVETGVVTPQKILETCLEYEIPSVSFTYTEPMTWFEFVLDSAVLLRKNHIKIVCVSNAYLNYEPLKKILQEIDSWNVDLKAFTNDFYKNICSGELEVVKRNIELIYQKSHLELTNLIIPGLNDDIKDFKKMINFIANISTDIPLHLSAYHPEYKRVNRRTSLDELRLFYKEAKKHLNYVYIGNYGFIDESNTICPGCGEVLVIRNKKINNITNGLCPKCKKSIYGF